MFLTGEESREESQQAGVQGGESPAGEADVEPEDKRSGPEAVVADQRRSAHTDFFYLLAVTLQRSGQDDKQPQNKED